MTSFGYRLNPRYAIKECSSCGTLYTRDCVCSKRNVEDKILVPKLPKHCARCGHPVDGPYCQGCALLRQELEEDLVTHSQDFQNTFESSNDSTNVVNAPREPFVVKQDNGSFVDKIICNLNRAPDSPHLHTISPNQFHCFHCKDVLGDAYQCQPMNEDYYYGHNSCYDSTSIGFDQSQPQQYIVNHHIFNAHNDYLDSQIKLNNTLTKLMEQMTSLTSFGEMACQVVQKKQEEKHLEEESNSLEDNIISGLPPCSAISPNEPVLSTEEPDNSLNSFSIDNIDYVEASPPDPELVSSEVMEIVIPEVGGIDGDILLTIKDDILREKLLNVNLLIAKIEALNDNPT
uniref:Uncharacterized protein n=1 Tax=Tanacetum cinerariifolium TaxID=118510 RepID=A0A699JAR5_TANCI|nr:hypothetical protein [Tanacetum cinerariifolium]